MASRGELCKRRSKSESDCAMRRETASPGVNWMMGLEELGGQMMFPARWRKWWRVREREDLSFGRTEVKKKDGFDCD